ncbi:MAG: hypothetical protein D6690_14595 [Nitrospirae bacterium]|nr:MAG: hypothetical protein D6690_14595 [Nitrospirota bacterium]
MSMVEEFLIEAPSERAEPIVTVLPAVLEEIVEEGLDRFGDGIRNFEALVVFIEEVAVLAAISVVFDYDDANAILTECGGE